MEFGGIPLESGSTKEWLNNAQGTAMPKVIDSMFVNAQLLRGLIQDGVMGFM